MTGRGRRQTADHLRVIGGRWRGSKLTIHENPALRPTGDRVRETLFNWLGASVQNARCLDLFAGSGALGIEALSRGAAHCDFVEADNGTASLLRQQLQRLGAAALGRVHCNDATKVAPPDTPWDVVFIDPPFDLRLAAPVLEHLRTPGLLAERAEVYVETAVADPTLDQLPAGYDVWRDKQSGDVRYALLLAP